MPARQSLARKARAIRMVLLDVDGVMTDGGLWYSANGIELKRFHAHDGYAIVRAYEHGLKVGIITGRHSLIASARAKALNIDDVFLGADDKVAALRELQQRHGLKDHEFAYVGDDLFDLPLLRTVGLSAAPGNARREVRQAVDYVAKARGGEGVVREVIDLVLHHQHHAARGPDATLSPAAKRRKK